MDNYLNDANHTVDGKVDAFSLSCTFYDTLFGIEPFDDSKRDQLPDFENQSIKHDPRLIELSKV